MNAQKETMTDLDIHRCYRVTKTLIKDLEECRKVCEYAKRCKALWEA